MSLKLTNDKSDNSSPKSQVDLSFVFVDRITNKGDIVPCSVSECLSALLVCITGSGFRDNTVSYCIF